MDQATFNQLTEQSKNTITAKVICDSVNPDGVRLTTMEWTYPRCIHSEIMTHRKLSRNAASSRAIPLAKMIERVQSNPFFPIHWGANQKGMQATQELGKEQKLLAAQAWMHARYHAISEAMNLESIGVHKQIGNRLLEPWMWITVIVSATNFENLFALRCHPAAEPHFQNLAYKIRNALDASKPSLLDWGMWHLPLVSCEECDHTEGKFYIVPEDRPKVSAGRCARVSYLTHDGKRDPAEDIRLYQQLAGSFPIHASPLEHPALAEKPEDSCMPKHHHRDWGNFDAGWLSFRKMHPNENVTKRVQ